MPAPAFLNRGRLARAALILSAAVLMGAIAAGQSLLSTMPEQRYTPTHALIMNTPFWVFWATCFPLVLWLVRTINARVRNIALIAAAHIAAAVVLTVAVYTVHMWFMDAIGHGTWGGDEQSYAAHWAEGLRYRLLPNLGGYVMLLAVVLASEYYRKYRDRELEASQLSAQLSQARLEALRMQLNPHFLFNAMNTIAMLVRRNDNNRAVKMLAGLSDLLRYVLQDSTADEVPLREEVAFLERYLEIERVRFQDRLTVRLDIAEETRDALVPNLLLQPLAENAIKHGIARKVSGGTIEIAARRLGDRLIVQVSDDGAGFTAPSLTGSGVGLANTRSRLEQLYGGRAGFELRPGSLGGAVATVSLPFHTQPLTKAVTAA